MERCAIVQEISKIKIMLVFRIIDLADKTIKINEYKGPQVIVFINKNLGTVFARATLEKVKGRGECPHPFYP